MLSVVVQVFQMPTIAENALFKKRIVMVVQRLSIWVCLGKGVGGFWERRRFYVVGIFVGYFFF